MLDLYGKCNLPLQDTYWQRVLFSGHLDHLAAEGYDVDDTVRSQALMPQQEMLMKMFAVSSTIKFLA